MNIANWLYTSALAYPGAPALLSGEEVRANYRRFAETACALGRHLREVRGLGEGARIAVYMKNRTEYLSLLYAAWWIGAVVVPVNHKLHLRELTWILENAGASALFTDDGRVLESAGLTDDCVEIGVDTDVFREVACRDVVLGQPAILDPGTFAWLFYTSGTTGRPKGAMLTHGNLVAMSLCYAMDVEEVTQRDAVLYAAPISHGAGLYNFAHVRHGARHVVPASRGFDGREILDLAERVGNLSLFAAPTMVKRLVSEARAANRDGAGIKSIIYGGGPMYRADIEEALKVFGAKFVQIYGQGESPMTITVLRRSMIADSKNPRWQERLASVGVAQACVDVRVVDERMAPVACRTPGEVVVRGDTVMHGYWRNPAATAEAIVDGWLKTGDIGYLSEDGFLTLTDRSKDVVITGGSNVYPREVEEVLARHPDIEEVAVIGSPHPEWGEEVVAFVTPVTGKRIATTDLDDWCKEELASFKKPKRYEFCEGLPKNSYGKVLKTELRERASRPKKPGTANQA